MRPLIYSKYTCIVDLKIRVRGGGTNGQTDCIRLAIAKALACFDKPIRSLLKNYNLLLQDNRQKERKKPGLGGARKGPVYRRR